MLLSLNVPVAENCCVRPFEIDGLAGVTAIDCSAAVVTVNPPPSEATSPPVVIVTVRAPAVAPLCTVMLAVALVPLFTVRPLIVTPAPKLATVVPWTKFVF